MKIKYVAHGVCGGTIGRVGGVGEASDHHVVCPGMRPEVHRAAEPYGINATNLLRICGSAFLTMAYF